MRHLHGHDQLIFGVECTILYDRIGNKEAHMSACDGCLGETEGTRGILSVFQRALLLRTQLKPEVD